MMRVADPLAEARKYLTTLQTYCADRVATHMAACEVFRRLGALCLLCARHNLCGHSLPV
jgi:hypothetical protein